MSENNSVQDSFVSRWSKRKLQKREAKVALDPVADNTPQAAETSTDPYGVNDAVWPGVGTAADTQALQTTENAAAETSAESETDAVTAQSIEQVQAAAIGESADGTEAEEPLLTDEDMPAIASLDSGSDVSMFFNRGVSKMLRKAALAHIFGLPVYNVRDGLNDYDDDYTQFEPLGDTVTCDMKYHERRLKKLEEEQAEEKARLEEEARAAEADEAAGESPEEAQEEQVEQVEQASAEQDSLPDEHASEGQDASSDSEPAESEATGAGIPDNDTAELHAQRVVDTADADTAGQDRS